MYIAVDIGGTNTRVVGARSLTEHTFVGKALSQRNTGDYQADLEFIVEAARRIAGDDIQAVGMGIVGTLDAAKQLIVSVNNRPHWKGKPFVADLSKRLNCPVYADNDAVAAALGEAYYGKQPRDFAYIIWGTGVGGVMVTHDTSGNHVLHDLNTNWARYFGTWEAECGGRSLERTHGKAPELFSEPEWQAVLRTVAHHAKVFVEMVRPQALVFGGGLSVRHAAALRALADELQLPCSVTTFGDTGGLVGGLAVIKNTVG